MGTVRNQELDRGGFGWNRIYADRSQHDLKDADTALSHHGGSDRRGDHADGGGAWKTCGILPTGVRDRGGHVHDEYGRFRKCGGSEQCAQDGTSAVRADRYEVLRGANADTWGNPGSDIRMTEIAA